VRRLPLPRSWGIFALVPFEWKLAFETGVRPKSKDFPLNISFDSLPKRLGSCEAHEFNEPALLFAHFIFVQDIVTALLRGLQPFAESGIVAGFERFHSRSQSSQ
jgi:hypothetical protein